MIGFPAAVERYIERVLRERANPVMLSFDRKWNLIEILGDVSHFSLNVSAGGSDLHLLRDLFLGLPEGEPQDFPFVGLPGGRCAHVHGVPDGGLFHVLLLDASEEFARVQEQQQQGNQAELISQEKSKALARLRAVRSELESQRNRLEEANALKNALIATLSHEFRTPLTSIFGYMHLLERRCGDDATQRQALRAVRRNATYLFALAENLLEYGRGEAAPGLLNPVLVDLPALVADLDAMFRPLAEDKGLAFSIELGDMPCDALFDEIKLRQIAINLLSNALRYTMRGKVAARVFGDERQLVLEVSDTGIGVPADARQRVFTPFNRGGQNGSKGAGLGLSIVKRLVEQMHGALELDSELGVGSTFRVRLPPLGQATAGETPARSGEKPAGADELWLKGYRAVVLDDDPDVSGLLALLLEDLGFEVEVLREAARAVARVREAPPHVMLVDVELPGLSGNAAVYQLRAHGYAGRIITLSATATEEARAAALAAGADFYLTKPINLEQFVRVLQRAVHS